MYALWRTDINDLIKDIGESTSYVGETMHRNWEIHLGASYSLICVNKTSGELTFGQGESAFFFGRGERNDF